MNIITRRAFMKTMGLLSLLGVSPDILNSLDCHATEFEDRDKNETSIPACFIGVGDFGQKISKALKKSLHYDPFNSQNQFHFQNEIAMLDSTDNNFDLNRFQEPLIFLAGDTLDPNFWTVRDFIISKNPELIITIALTDESGFKGSIFNNERWITVPQAESVSTAFNIIDDLHSEFKLDGLPCVLSEGIGFGISMESTMEESALQLRMLVNRHLDILKHCENLLLFLSFDNRVGVKEDRFAELCEIAFHDLCHEPRNSCFFWNDRELNPAFRATIITY